MENIPESIRVPLDEIWADIDAHVGRVRMEQEFAPVLVESVRSKISAAKRAISEELAKRVKIS